MAECSKCGKQSMSFTCRYCGKKFCSEHRLPENHDCKGLESGKKEEFKEEKNDESSGQQKWFNEKFSNKKEKGKRSRKKEFQNPSFFNETKRIVKSNLALMIILVTGISFMLHEASPIIKNFFSMSPALTQTAVEATNNAANQVQPGIGNILGKTIIEAPWTLFTIMLVHSSLFHFLANMVTFYFFGTAAEKTLGGLKMLKIYITAGLAASIGYIAFRNFLYILYGPISNDLITLLPAVGASGAVIAMVGLIAMLYPESEVLLYFVIPMKIMTAVKALAVIELFSLATKIFAINIPILSNLAASAHLTGLAVGLFFGKKLQDKYGRKTSVFNPMGY